MSADQFHRFTSAAEAEAFAAGKDGAIVRHFPARSARVRQVVEDDDALAAVAAAGPLAKAAAEIVESSYHRRGRSFAVAAECVAMDGDFRTIPDRGRALWAALAACPRREEIIAPATPEIWEVLIPGRISPPDTSYSGGDDSGGWFGDGD